MNSGIFPGLPDDFGGESAALHPDPGPWWGSERRKPHVPVTNPQFQTIATEEMYYLPGEFRLSTDNS